jgi:AcrR family transcriptional regulator
MSEVVRPYRGVSAHERRGRRREQLTEAALDLLGSEGMAGTTMTAVCARAGLTERYFYESFRDRDQLLVALFDACLMELDQAMFAALDVAPPDLLARCRAAAGAMIGVLTADPRKARFYAEAVGSETLKDRRADAVRAHADVLAGQIRELRGLERAADEALRLATRVLFAGLAEALPSWLDGTLELSREALIEVCARLGVAVADAVQVTASS